MTNLFLLVVLVGLLNSALTSLQSFTLQYTCAQRNAFKSLLMCNYMCVSYNSSSLNNSTLSHSSYFSFTSLLSFLSFSFSTFVSRLEYSVPASINITSFLFHQHKHACSYCIYETMVSLETIY